MKPYVLSAFAAATLVSLAACQPTAPNAPAASPSGQASKSPSTSPSAIASTLPSTAPGTPAAYESVKGMKATFDGADVALTNIQKAKNSNGIALNATGPNSNNVIFSLADTKNRAEINANTPPENVAMNSGLWNVGGTTYLFDATVTPTQELKLTSEGFKGFMAFSLVQPGTMTKKPARIDFNFAWSEF